MTLRHFQIFVVVSDCMNMTMAANQLYMSQSAVSQAIGELERHYEVKLFERLSRKLYLTHAGESLLGYARHIIRLNLEAENEMKNQQDNGLVRVGASVTIAACILPRLAAALQQTFPKLRFEVTEDNTAKIEALLFRDELDLGLVEGAISSADLLCKPFAQDRLLLLCSRDHPFTKRSTIDRLELERENFILREPGSGTRQLFESRMREHGIRWQSSWTCTNTESIKLAVAENLGITVLSELAAKREVDSGSLVPIPVEGLVFERQFQLIYHKNKYLTKSMQHLIAFCFDVTFT